jgi:RHS repeat-associated protein
VYGGAITLTGTNATKYALLSSSTCINASGVSVAAGGSCTVDVKFTPPSGASSGVPYVATLTLNLNTASTPVNIALTGKLDAAPVVILASPAANTSTGVPGSFTLTATASSTTSTIAKVEFYANDGITNTLIGTVTSAPYSYTWSNVALGSYTLTAKATDSLGLTTTSAGKTLTVNSTLNVSLTSPAGNTILAAPGNLVVTASATSGGSTISQVEFYLNGIRVSVATSAPYTYAWNNIAAGQYTLNALATDALGKTAISTSRTVTVTNAAGATGLYYLHTDQLDTPRVITDTAGNKVWEWENLDPFGNNVPNQNPSGLGTFEYNQRFPGQYFDKETGLHQNFFRDYDPGNGRYIESDPIGLQGGINTYGYALQNPLSYTDLLGLEVKILCRPAKIAGGYINHCWVQTDTKSAGMGADPNILPGEQYEGYGMPVQIIDHSKDTATQSTTINNVNEQCVNDKLKIGKPLGRFLPPFNQCQSFAYGVVNSCRTGPQMSPAQ